MQLMGRAPVREQEIVADNAVVVLVARIAVLLLVPEFACPDPEADVGTSMG